MAEKNGLETYFFSVMLGKAVLKELIKDDLKWGIGAALFLLFYLALHLKSFFLAVYTIMLIGFSFALT